MARSLSSLKLLAASVSDGLSLSISRRGRGYSAVPQGQGAVTASFGRVRGGSRPGMVGKVDQIQKAMTKEESGITSAWAPDPVTGYYRPGNCAAEIDPAELREMLLNHKVRPH